MAIYLRVRDPEKVIFEGQVDSISSTNKIGKFDILDSHSNFISLIQQFLVYKIGESVKEFKVNNGILKVRENKVYVYLGVKRV